MLCPQCEAIFDKPYFSKFGTIPSMSNVKNSKSDFTLHHASHASFQAALTSNCGLCQRILRKFLTKQRSCFNEDGELHSTIDARTFNLNWRMNFETRSRTVVGFRSLLSAHKEGRPWNDKADIHMFWVEAQCGLSEPNMPPPERSDDDRIMPLISQWIIDCQQNHSKCRSSSSNPTKASFARILDVDVKSSPTIRLCEAGDILVETPYLTLSHCWGGATIPVLTKDKYSQYLESISIEDLPQTFADAVRLTRNLNFRYLWIDSMCIVQDSSDDWLDHSAQMDEIYRNSSCNISSSRASNPHVGIFANRNPVFLTPLRISIKRAALDGSDGWYDVDDDFSEEWATQVGRSAVSKRAWVMQERLLAPRVVHFGNTQLFWECVERQTREADTWAGITEPNSRNILVDFKTLNPLAHGIIQNSESRKLTLNYIWSAAKAIHGQDSVPFTKKQLQDEPQVLAEAQKACFGELSWMTTHPLLAYWASIVKIYTTLSLSREDDRLVAIAGMAKILHARTGISYVAGHWCYQLPRQLLWGPSTAVKPKERDGIYVAPSWSWASRSSDALWFLKLEPILEVNGAMDLVQIQKIEAQGFRGEENPMDKLRSARLRLRARLLPIELDLSKWPEHYDRENEMVQYLIPSVFDPPVRETFLVPVLFIKWDEKLPKATPNALLLEATGTKGNFRRIGTARLSNFCALSWVTPNLYSAKIDIFEDSDDDENEDGVLNSGSRPHEETNTQSDEYRPVRPPSVRDQFRESRAKQLQDPQFMKRFETSAQRMIGQKDANPRRQEALQKLQTRYSALANMASGRPRDRPFVITDKMRDDIEKSMKDEFGINVTVGGRKKRPSEIPKLAPKEAVDSQFYLEYIEDADSLRYGHFIFDVL